MSWFIYPFYIMLNSLTLRTEAARQFCFCNLPTVSCVCNDTERARKISHLFEKCLSPHPLPSKKTWRTLQLRTALRNQKIDCSTFTSNTVTISTGDYCRAKHVFLTGDPLNYTVRVMTRSIFRGGIVTDETWTLEHYTACELIEWLKQNNHL